MNIIKHENDFIRHIVTIKNLSNKTIIIYFEKNTFTSTSFQQFESYRDLALIDLLISTGIRIGEACKITLNDINLVDKVILIHGKGRKERVIYISSLDTYRNIKNYLK